MAVCPRCGRSLALPARPWALATPTRGCATASSQARRPSSSRPAARRWVGFPDPPGVAGAAYVSTRFRCPAMRMRDTPGEYRRWRRGRPHRCPPTVIGPHRSRVRSARTEPSREADPSRPGSWCMIRGPEAPWRRARGLADPGSSPARIHPHGRAGTTFLHRSPRGAPRPSDQANLPAQEAPPRQGARLPCAYEVAGRPQGARLTARTWPPEAHRLTAGPPIRVPCQPSARVATSTASSPWVARARVD